jgi:hypothetical protein
MNLITKRALLLGSGALIGGYFGAKLGPKTPFLMERHRCNPPQRPTP